MHSAALAAGPQKLHGRCAYALHMYALPPGSRRTRSAYPPDGVGMGRGAPTLRPPAGSHRRVSARLGRRRRWTRQSRLLRAAREKIGRGAVASGCRRADRRGSGWGMGGGGGVRGGTRSGSPGQPPEARRPTGSARFGSRLPVGRGGARVPDVAARVACERAARGMPAWRRGCAAAGPVVRQSSSRGDPFHPSHCRPGWLPLRATPPPPPQPAHAEPGCHEQLHQRARRGPCAPEARLTQRLGNISPILPPAAAGRDRLTRRTAADKPVAVRDGSPAAM